MRDRQPIEHERLEKLQSTRRRFLGRSGWVFLAGLIILVGSPIMWSKLKGDYTIRAQVSAGTNVAFRVRSAVEAYVEKHDELPASNEDAGLPPANEISDRYVGQIGIHDGQIIVVYGKAADARIVGKTIVFVPGFSDQSDISWTCSSPDLPAKWLPSMCQSS